MNKKNYMYCLLVVFLFVGSVSTTNAQTKKRVLVEQITSFENGETPEGLVKMADALQTFGDDVIFVNLHKSDAATLYTFPGNDLISDFSATVPSGLVDRTLFSGETEIALAPAKWSTNISTQLNAAPMIKIDITEVKFSGDDFTVKTTVTFDQSVTGDIRIFCAIVEDKVSGTGVHFEQVNNYSSSGGHPFFGLGNPIVDFEHPRVLRKFLTNGAYGDFIVPDSAFPPHTYPSTFSYDRIFNGQVYYHENKHRLHAVVYVAYYDAANIDKRQVINVAQKKLSATSVEEDVVVNEISEVYPNPVQDLARVEFSLIDESHISFEICNTMGQIVIADEGRSYMPGSHHYYFSASNLPRGSYFVRMKANNQYITKKFIK